jgi:F-box-like
VDSLEGVLEQITHLEEERVDLVHDSRIVSLIDTISERLGRPSAPAIPAPPKHQPSWRHLGKVEGCRTTGLGKSEGSGPSLSTPIESLPTEVLLQVFDRLLPPRYLYEYTAAHTENSLLSIATTQKKALMSVCRSWHQASKPFLYEDVVIRRHPQLFLILDSIRRTPSNARLVKSLHITCFIQESWAGAFSKALQQTVDSLDALTSFTFHAAVTALPPSFTLPHFTHGLVTLRVEPYDAVSRTNALDLAVALRLDLSVFANLQELSLYSLSADDSFSSSKALMSLQLPLLEEITLIPICNTWLSCITTWYMPNLRRATLTAGKNTTTAFLNRHGCKLKELQLIRRGSHAAAYRKDGTAEGIQDRSLQSLCPQLEHLVISTAYLTSWSLQHDKLHSLDLWVRAGLSHPPCTDGLTLDQCPLLRRLRIFSEALERLEAIPFQIPHCFFLDTPEAQFFSIRLRPFDTDCCSITEGALLLDSPEDESEDGSFTDDEDQDAQESDWDSSDFGEPEVQKLRVDDGLPFTLHLSGSSSNDVPQEIAARAEGGIVMWSLLEDW